METSTNPRPPATVLVAAVAFSAALVANVAGYAQNPEYFDTGNSPTAVPSSFVVLFRLIVFAATAFVIYSFVRGEKWTRVFYVLLFVLNRLLLIIPFKNYSLFSLYAADDTLTVLGLVAAFLPQSNRWFDEVDRSFPPRKKPPSSRVVVPILMFCFATLLLYQPMKRYINSPHLMPDTAIVLYLNLGLAGIYLTSAAFLMQSKQWASRLFLFGVPATLVVAFLFAGADPHLRGPFAGRLGTAFGISAVAYALFAALVLGVVEGRLSTAPGDPEQGSGEDPEDETSRRS
jgi:hypothetical protein